MHIIYTIVCACMCTLVTYTSAKWPISAPIAMALCAPGDAKAPAASNRAGKACFWRCEPCWFPRFDAKNVVLFPHNLYMYIATSWCLTHKSLHVIKTWNKIWHTFFLISVIYVSENDEAYRLKLPLKFYLSHTISVIGRTFVAVDQSILSHIFGPRL